jgi:hypothetical protein
MTPADPEQRRRTEGDGWNEIRPVKKAEKLGT